MGLQLAAKSYFQMIFCVTFLTVTFTSFTLSYLHDHPISERGREGRLTRLLAQVRDMDIVGTNIGIGLDEATSIHIRNVNTDNEIGEVWMDVIGFETNIGDIHYCNDLLENIAHFW